MYCRMWKIDRRVVLSRQGLKTYPKTKRNRSMTDTRLVCRVKEEEVKVRERAENAMSVWLAAVRGTKKRSSGVFFLKRKKLCKKNPTKQKEVEFEVSVKGGRRRRKLKEGAKEFVQKSCCERGSRRRRTSTRYWWLRFFGFFFVNEGEEEKEGKQEGSFSFQVAEKEEEVRRGETKGGAGESETKAEVKRGRL
jgi:hypothetical protein